MLRWLRARPRSPSFFLFGWEAPLRLPLAILVPSFPVSFHPSNAFLPFPPLLAAAPSALSPRPKNTHAHNHPRDTLSHCRCLLLHGRRRSPRTPHQRARPVPPSGHTHASPPPPLLTFLRKKFGCVLSMVGRILSSWSWFLDEIGHVERHLLDLRVVELLDVLEVAHVALVVFVVSW